MVTTGKSHTAFVSQPDHEKNSSSSLLHLSSSSSSSSSSTNKEKIYGFER